MRFGFVGMPEGHLPLTQAAIYLASPRKANTAVTTYADCPRPRGRARRFASALHLRNPSSALGRSMGLGKDYKYPHTYDGHFVVEDYLPDELKGRHYYQAVK